MERTVVILKPDALARGLVGEITARLERKGLKIVGCKMLHLSKGMLQEHYSHLATKSYFPRIAAFMSSLPVIVQCWAGREAVEVVRKLVGLTNGRDSAPGTIRGDFSMSVQCNLVHASEDLAAAGEEVRRFFAPEELLDFSVPLASFVYSVDEM